MTSHVLLQGVRTPILQLSAMQEGDYTFQLTVTDSAGQQETAHVTVIVQPGKHPVSNKKRSCLSVFSYVIEYSLTNICSALGS